MDLDQHTILVVDDEESIRDMLKMVFVNKKFKVKTAESAEAALELLKDENIYIMFLDLNLPGMNGIELCKKIRKNIPFAMIHAITGYASLFELSDCREAGFDDYFTKPIKLSMLLKTAKDAVEKINRWRKK